MQERSATAATSCPPTTSDTARVVASTGCPGTGRRAPSPSPSTASTPSPPDTSGEIQIPRLIQIQIPTWTGVSASRTSLPAGPCTTPRRTPTSTTARASDRFVAFFASFIGADFDMMKIRGFHASTSAIHFSSIIISYLLRHQSFLLQNCF